MDYSCTELANNEIRKKVIFSLFPRGPDVLCESPLLTSALSEWKK